MSASENELLFPFTSFTSFSVTLLLALSLYVALKYKYNIYHCSKCAGQLQTATHRDEMSNPVKSPIYLSGFCMSYVFLSTFATAITNTQLNLNNTLTICGISLFSQSLNSKTKTLSFPIYAQQILTWLLFSQAFSIPL